MKYDFETIIDRDPAIRGTGKYRIMKDSKGNKPPKGIVPLSVADMEFRTAPCVIDAIKAEADFGAAGSGYQRINVACPRKTLADALDRFYQAARKRGMAR